MGSRVARYAVAQGTLESQRVSESVSYAELWLAAHPSGAIPRYASFRLLFFWGF
jgi:mannose-6-phosphate isomerase class I